MNTSDVPREETPDYYRRRYLELKAQAEAVNARRTAAEASDNPQTIPHELVVMEETVPGFWYWTQKVPRGLSLRIVNDFATPGVSVFLWNADDPSERYNAPDTVKVQWTSRLTHGKLLLSDIGRVMASITADTSGMHDSIAGGSTPESNARKYGQRAVWRNTRDNFLLAAGKHGLGPRDIGACTTFFAPVTVGESGCFVWHGAPKSGDYVDLRAEMNLIVALSNCPHPLAPSNAPDAQPIRAIVWRSPPPGPRDLCRNASEEAVRAFQNTDAVFRGGRSEQ